MLELANKLSLGIWPDWLTVSRDQIALLQHDNIVSAMRQLPAGRCKAWALPLNPTRPSSRPIFTASERPDSSKHARQPE